MKNTKQMAYLRQLCCLGLGKDMVIPEFLKAVQTVIPSGSNVMTFVNENGSPVESIAEWFVPDKVAIAMKLLPDLFTVSRVNFFNEIYHRDKFISHEIFKNINFYTSDFYHLVWLPCEQYFFIQVPIYICSQLCGQIWLFRSPKHHPFSVAEQQIAIQLSPYIAHALQKRTDCDMAYINSGQSSLFIADCKGTIIYSGSEAQRLLTLSTQLTSYQRGLASPVKLPPALIKLCRNLNSIFKGENTHPPVLTVTNSAGRFTFRAYWLDRQNNEPDGLIGITIEHQEPIRLYMLRSLHQEQLSTKQREVALMLALGHNHEQVGQNLHIKVTTVRDHIQKIYTKLEIHTIDELKTKLLK
jgi:DNA-binding CsgD family transcriptional regulator